MYIDLSVKLFSMIR